MAMRTKEQRIVVVMVDADEVEEAAASSKCSVADFIGLAVADAMFSASDAQVGSVHLMVDGKGMTVTLSAGGLGAV